MLYDVDDWSMDLAELQHKARVVVWTRGTRGTRGLGGVGCALEECAAKISTLYICISTYALRVRLEPGRRFIPFVTAGNRLLKF